MSQKARKSPPSSERQLNDIYAEIPAMKSCSGKCDVACGPIAMLDAEWTRIKRAKGGRPPRYVHGSLRCPLLSPTGRCTVYSVRPYICRLWGTIETLACPEGCQPERWLSREEAQDIFNRLVAVTGPKTNGPVGSVNDLWEAFALDARAERAAKIELIRQAKLRGEL